MKRYYCTYFDRKYLVKAITLVDSLNRHEQNEFELFAICLDELSRTLLKKLNLKNVTPVGLHEFETYDPQLLKAKYNRELKEYYFTMTPTLILRLLEWNPEIDVLTYLDADLFFFSSPDPIFEELSSGSVLIHPHRFPPRLKELEMYGKYNVGLLSFRNDEAGHEVLRWWRESCLEWCYARAEDGKYADQKYLDDWLTRFDGIVELKNVGAGLGPWNHEQYDYHKDADGRIWVDKTQLVFYHFHALFFSAPQIITPANDVNYNYKVDILKLCVLPYIRKLYDIIPQVRELLPESHFSLGNNIVHPKLTIVVHKKATDAVLQLRLPFKRIELDSSWDCYCSPQVVDLEAHCSKSAVTGNKN